MVLHLHLSTQQNTLTIDLYKRKGGHITGTHWQIGSTKYLYNIWKCCHEHILKWYQSLIYGDSIDLGRGWILVGGSAQFLQKTWHQETEGASMVSATMYVETGRFRQSKLVGTQLPRISGTLKWRVSWTLWGRLFWGGFISYISLTSIQLKYGCFVPPL